MEDDKLLEAYEASIMTLEELLATDLMPKNEEEFKQAREEEYRRGYLDGFWVAIDTFWEGMFESSLSRQAAYDQLYAFVTDSLLSWRTQGDCKTEIWPPSPKFKRTYT